MDVLQKPDASCLKAENEMATHRMYSKIVDDENDIIGLVAYALYKQHKIEFFKKARIENNGDEPSEEAIRAFIQSSSTDSQIKKYRAEAESILSDVVINVTREQINQAEREMLESYQTKIREAVKKETPGKGQTIFLNVVGTALFSIIITIVFIIGNFSERGTKYFADKVASEMQTDTNHTIQIDSIQEPPSNKK